MRELLTELEGPRGVFSDAVQAGRGDTDLLGRGRGNLREGCDFPLAFRECEFLAAGMVEEERGDRENCAESDTAGDGEERQTGERCCGLTADQAGGDK